MPRPKCSEVRENFQRLISQTDFRKEALEWNFSFFHRDPCFCRILRNGLARGVIRCFAIQKRASQNSELADSRVLPSSARKSAATTKMTNVTTMPRSPGDKLFSLPI